MSVKTSFIVFTIFLIKFSTSVEETCQMKQEVIKQQYEDLLQTFNMSEPSPPPSKCQEYLDAIYKTIDAVNEDTFLDQIKGEEFEEARKQFQDDWDAIETNFKSTKKFLEEQFEAQEDEISNKIGIANDEIDKITEEEERSIKKHQETIKTYDKCGYQSRNVQFKTHKLFKSSSFFTDPVVMCDVPSQWFLDLKALVDTKVSSPEDLLPTDDCNKKRKWFLSVNSIFQEAIDQISDNYDIDTYKATLQKRLNDRKREIDDTINQIKKENERNLQMDLDFLQTRNAELQKVKSHFEDVQNQQKDEVVALGAKLIGCARYELVNQLIDEVNEKYFMKQVFIKAYETSTANDKAESLMLFLATVKELCRRFEGYVILYYEIIAQKEQDNPTMIEVINQVRNLRQPGANCGVEYNQNDFLSPSLVTDPIVDHILDILADSIKVGNYDKAITFNYHYTLTFQEILSTLVSKSYTGNNLSYMLSFVDELYWMVHKFDVLSQLLDISPPTSKNDKKDFKDCVDRAAGSDPLNNEDTDRLLALRAKMKRYGIE